MDNLPGDFQKKSEILLVMRFEFRRLLPEGDTFFNLISLKKYIYKW